MFDFGPGMTINAAALFFIGLAAYYDAKTRTAPNWIWVCMIFLGLGALYYHPTTITTFIINAGLVIAAGAVLYKLGMGGADFKAIIALAIVYYSLPLVPLMALIAAHVMTFAIIFASGRRRLQVPYLVCLGACLLWVVTFLSFTA